MKWSPFRKTAKPVSKRVPPTVRRRAYQTHLAGMPGAINWASQTTADADVRDAQKRKRATARQEVQNSDFLAGFLLSAQKNVIGEGLQCRSLYPDLLVAKQIETLWRKWEENAARNGDSWWETEWMMVSSLLVDGEVFLHVAPDPDNGIVVRLVDPGTLGTDFNRDLGNGHVINMGIEKRDWKPIAYWFRSWHERPTNSGDSYSSGDRVRISADEILRVSWRQIVGQTRGMPFVSTALLRIESLRHYDISELTSARVANKQQAFIEQTADDTIALETHDQTRASDNGKEDGDEEDDEPDLSDPIEQNRLLARQYQAGGGGVDYDMSVDFLDPGQKFVMANWNHPNGQYPAFVQTQLRGAAAGLGVPYHQLAGDLSAINFSAGRIGELAARRTWLVIRKMLVQRIHRPLFKRWMEEALLSSDMPAIRLDAAQESRFTGPGFPHIQPKEAAIADETDINNFLKSRSHVIRERGQEPAEVFAEIADEDELLRELGLERINKPAATNDDKEEDGMPDEDEEGNLKDDGTKTARPLASRATRDSIRAERSAGASYRALAERYGASKTAIEYMLAGRTYKRDNTR